MVFLPPTSSLCRLNWNSSMRLNCDSSLSVGDVRNAASSYESVSTPYRWAYGARVLCTEYKGTSVWL